MIYVCCALFMLFVCYGVCGLCYTMTEYIELYNVAVYYIILCIICVCTVCVKHMQKTCHSAKKYLFLRSFQNNIIFTFCMYIFIYTYLHFIIYILYIYRLYAHCIHIIYILYIHIIYIIYIQTHTLHGYVLASQNKNKTNTSESNPNTAQ